MLARQDDKTGKSTIISNLLLNESFFGPEYFDDVHIISNTINNDVTSRFLKERFNVEDTYNDEIFSKLLEKQKSYEKWRRRTNLRSHCSWMMCWAPSSGWLRST
eukprot:SAG31_NODE_918_length_11020_cov_14.801392_2_plen_104_part_00